MEWIPHPPLNLPSTFASASRHLSIALHPGRMVGWEFGTRGAQAWSRLTAEKSGFEDSWVLAPSQTHLISEETEA